VANLGCVRRVVHAPSVVEPDEDGEWWAHAELRPIAAAHGEGDTPEAAVVNLCEVLMGLAAEFVVPGELTLTIDVA
jgi:predicted RNase H-like HicB family nuclease